jgi:hypothetical protein
MDEHMATWPMILVTLAMQGHQEATELLDILVEPMLAQTDIERIKEFIDQNS